MSGRTIAIGDIHGYVDALNALLEAIVPEADDTIVALGDFVDRGPDSRAVIERLIELGRQCRLVPILGNHDELLLDVCRGSMYQMGNWLLFGGDATLASYDGRVPNGVPQEHVDFLADCRDWHENERHFFVHGAYDHNRPLERQAWGQLRWQSLSEREPLAHCSGKTAIVGHTAQKTGEILDLGFIKCIDTWIYGDGWLTALDVDSGQVWQAGKEGELRE